MARGGRRSGTPGKAYGNRSDLQTAIPKAGPSQGYGQRAALERAQQEMPMAAPSAPAPSGGPAPQAGPPQPRLNVPLDAETQRPNEPITAGAPMGAGPGPEAMGMPSMGDPTADELRALYARFPDNDAVRELIEELESEGVNQ